MVEKENAIIVFDDILGSTSSRSIDQFFVKGRHNNLDFYNLSQSFFDLREKTKRSNSNENILLVQTLKDVYTDSEGYDKSYDGFK